ncbi:MAG TPA: hypothetical protein VG367_19870 [Mucilaginibacter sp.]|jgi:hypothetical protein|nr:hypothetical protein [Mucilaginibacter sp.]
MRTFAFAFLLLALSACKKFDENNISLPKGTKPVWVPPMDTIPDNATLTLKLIEDSTAHDETEFIFDQKASTAFSYANDAPYFTGFGKVSLASISSDGRDMAIYSLPYKTGMSVDMDVRGRKDGKLNLEISRETNIPQDIRVLVKDKYANDSLDLCKGVYSFKVATADSNSFGKHRLTLVLQSVPEH